MTKTYKEIMEEKRVTNAYNNHIAKQLQDMAIAFTTELTYVSDMTLEMQLDLFELLVKKQLTHRKK